MRIQWIDNAKGIAIFLVILGHVSGDLTGIWDFGFVYGIHLVMFFLLSGYLIKKRDITREWINAKFSRLMVPYFLTCFVIIITDVINSIILNYNGGGYTYNNKNNRKGYYTQLFCLRLNKIFWIY